MNLRISPFVLVGAGLILFGVLKAQEAELSWTHFRGDNLDGISTATHVPLVWNDSVHIGWKTAI